MRIGAGADDAQRDRHAAVGLLDRRDAAAVECRVDRVEHVAGLQSVQRERIGLQTKREARAGAAARPGARAAVRQLLEHGGDLAGDLVVDVEVGAEHADRERRALAGQRFADALGEHRVDFDELVRIVVEHVADRGVDVRGRVTLLRIDLHFELALVRRVRILAVLGAADLLGDALHARNLRQRLRDVLRRCARFRRSRCRAAAMRARSDSSRGNPAAGARRAAAAARCRAMPLAISTPSSTRGRRSNALIVRSCQRLQRAGTRLRAAAGGSS